MPSYSMPIIDGGIALAALACSLAERGRLSSSELNGGDVRRTFAEEINLRIALA